MPLPSRIGRLRPPVLCLVVSKSDAKDGNIVDHLRPGTVVLCHDAGLTKRKVGMAAIPAILAGARELIAYSRRLGVPFGINVESVSIRRTEIEASVRLAAELRSELTKSR